MTKDSEKLLVIHNFGNSEIEIPLTDRTEKAIAVSGNVQEKEDHGNFYLKTRRICLRCLSSKKLIYENT